MNKSDFEKRIQNLIKQDNPKDIEFLNKSLDNLREEIQNADLKTSKLMIQVIIYCFIAIALITFPKEQVTIFFIKVEEISLIEIFCPVIISFKYFELITFLAYRSKSSKKYHILFDNLYPNVTKNKLENQFAPYSLINSLRGISESKGFVKVVGLIGFFILIVVIMFGSLGFLYYIYKILNAKYVLEGISDNLVNTVFYYISLTISIGLIVVGFSTTTNDLWGKREKEIK